MATDVHRRGHGRSLEGLSVVAGAAHLIPPDGVPRNNTQAALLRATYQQYMGVGSAPGDSTAGQLTMRHRLDSFGPKLVQGDYTYTTSRKSLLVSSQFVGGASLQPSGAPSAVPSVSSLQPRNTIPAMVPINAANINTAAWKAYGSPSARNHQRPPLAPGTTTTAAAASTGGTAGAPASNTGKLPRVGGFKPRRPQSAPGGAAGADDADLGAAIAAISSTVSVGTAGRRGGKGGPELMDVGVLAVEQPEPIRAGRTDSGRVMFEYTQPTDPYAKYVWEDQARKARLNMTRHIAAMAAAAAVNGGSAFSHGGNSGFAPVASAGGGGGGGANRPGSAPRGALGASLTAAAAAAVTMGPGTLGGGSAAAATRPRFSSTTLAEVARQGTDYKPPTVVGFSAPDLTEDSTMPGPGDPRWAYTRLGRTQICRLQQSLKMAAYHARLATRPSSAPALGGGAATAGAPPAGATGVSVGVDTDTSCGAVGVGVGSPERSLVRQELSVLDPFSDPTQGGAAAAAAIGAVGGGNGDGAGRVSEAHLLEPQRSSPAAMLRTVNSSCGTRPGSAGRARPGSATFGRAQSGNLARTGSPGLPRPGSASVMRTGSVNGAGALGVSINLSAALAAEASSAAAAAVAAVPLVRGASAGRSRESAPNPRVDLRAYLAEAEANAEEEEEEGAEVLPAGDVGTAGAAAGGLVYDGISGAVLLDGVPVPAEMLQSMPVPADQLAARLAEMVAAVAVVAAQKQIDGAYDGADRGPQPHVRFEEVVDDDGRPVAPAEAGMPEQPPATEAEEPAAAAPPSRSPPLQRFNRPDGDDALLALHGASNFGRGPGRFGNNAVNFSVRSGSGSGMGPYDAEGITDWGDDDAVPPLEQPLGLGLGLAPRHGKGAAGSGGGRPMSARPMSARPMSARPTSAMPGRRGGSPTRSLAESGGLEGGMDVIMEQSEGTVGEDC